MAHDILTEPSQLKLRFSFHPFATPYYSHSIHSCQLRRQVKPLTLLLLLLRGLGSLLLQVFDRFLRVVLVAAVGLDGALAVARQTLVPLSLALLLLLQLLLLQLLGFFGAGLVVCA